MLASRTSRMAVASLVLSILWFSWFGSLLAVVLGIVALRQIGDSNGRLTGRGMAIAGLVLGVAGIAFRVLYFVSSLLSNDIPAV